MNRSLRGIRWPRFSLMQMLASIGVAALACSSIVVPNGVFAALWQLTVFGMFSIAVAAAVYRNGATRAFWVGFALFGWLFVGSQRMHLFDMTGVATVFVEKVFFRGLEEFYRQQSVEAAETSIRRGKASVGISNPTVSGQAVTELRKIESWLQQSIFCFLALIIALLGGAITKWLYVTRPTPTKDIEERNLPG